MAGIGMKWKEKVAKRLKILDNYRTTIDDIGSRITIKVKGRPMNIKIRPCTVEDLNTLQLIAYETYNDTFLSSNTPETMEKYLNEAFNKDKLLAEILKVGSEFYFLYNDQYLAGYLKLNEVPAQSDINDSASLEIERIYVRQCYKGQGLGKTLMGFALKEAAIRNKDYVWLGVWEKNNDAIGFYKKMGFSGSGRHTFHMGDELQSDLIMKRTVR
jgi:ribosomal protein S18 acetylase RimI-like enzyme